MDIWVVSDGWYDNYEIVAIVSSEESANKLADSLKQSHISHGNDYYAEHVDVEKWELDSVPDLSPKPQPPRPDVLNQVTVQHGPPGTYRLYLRRTYTTDSEVDRMLEETYSEREIKPVLDWMNGFDKRDKCVSLYTRGGKIVPSFSVWIPRG